MIEAHTVNKNKETERERERDRGRERRKKGTISVGIQESRSLYIVYKGERGRECVYLRTGVFHREVASSSYGSTCHVECPLDRLRTIREIKPANRGLSYHVAAQRNG